MKLVSNRIDPDSVTIALSKDWWVTGMPSTFVINPQGDAVHHIVGKRDWDDAKHLQLLRQLIDSDWKRQLPTD